MEISPKKRGAVESQMGRPRSGILSTFHPEIVNQIKEWRSNYECWGPKTINIELKQCIKFTGLTIPSRSIIARFLKEQGYIKKAYAKRPQTNDVNKLPSVSRPHQRLQIDAMGNEVFPGVGPIGFINVKDVFTNLTTCILPASKKNIHSSATADEYRLALRLSFCEHGLPEQIQTDHAQVFYDNQHPSPFPTLFHLWLVGMGIELVYSRLKTPTDQGKVERQHLTTLWQVWRKSGYHNWNELFSLCEQRRNRLNFDLPCRTLSNKPPMTVFPDHYHSGRYYRPELEHEIFDLTKVDKYLAQHSWKRKVTKNERIIIAKQNYSIRQAKPGEIITIHYDAANRSFSFSFSDGILFTSLPAKGLDRDRIMGSNPIALPHDFQLQLPFGATEEGRLRLYETHPVTT